MSIFVVFRVTNPTKMKAAMTAAFPNDHYEIDEKEWLVSSKGTAKEVSDTLKVSGGENGNAIVFGMSGYFGRGPTPVWDWIKSKSEQVNG